MPKYCFFLLLAKVAVFVFTTASLVVYAQALSLKVTFVSKLLTCLICGIFYNPCFLDSHKITYIVTFSSPARCL